MLRKKDTSTIIIELLHFAHSRGLLSTLIILSSGEPGSGWCMYSQRAVSGRDIRMLSILAPGVYRPNFVPRSYTRLNSTYLWDEYHQVKHFYINDHFHISHYMEMIVK